MKKINIAVDGFSSCGKSTIAKGLAKELGYTYIDSGAMYRAVALFAYRNGWMTDTTIDEAALQKHISEIVISFETAPTGQQETYLNGENVEREIRSLEIGNGASRVSTLGFVRKELVRQQQAMGKKKGVVMDGSDIGTVVFPDAELKIFLTASRSEGSTSLRRTQPRARLLLRRDSGQRHRTGRKRHHTLGEPAT